MAAKERPCHLQVLVCSCLLAAVLVDGQTSGQGRAGATGATGLAGIPGFPGPSGPAGPMGPSGPVGPIGQRGYPGSPGLSGSPGPSGGATGATGFHGSTGATGPMGPPGPPGKPAPEGPQKGPQAAAKPVEKLMAAQQPTGNYPKTEVRMLWVSVGVSFLLVVFVVLLMVWNMKLSKKVADISEKHNLMRQWMDAREGYDKVAKNKV